MGTFTQRREFPKQIQGTTWRNGSPFGASGTGVASGLSIVGAMPFEQTTSWRTGHDAPDSADDLSRSSHRSWAEANREISRDSENRHSVLRQYDTGHNFKTEKKGIKTLFDGCSINYGGATYDYYGPWFIRPYVGNPGWGNFPAFDHVEFGSRAIDATSPTKSSSDLAVTLAELRREGWPKPGSGIRKYLSNDDPNGLQRAIAEEHLNFEFGAKPLYEEAVGLLDATINWRKRLEQYGRDSGQQVRRRYTAPIQDTLVELSYAPGWISPASTTTAIVSGCYPDGNRLDYMTVTRHTTRKMWFSGAFMYDLPLGDGLIDRVKRLESSLRYMTGLKIDSEVVWNLTPWSWLLDWNANIGRMISNAETLSRDGTVLKYGYVMCHTIQNTTIHGATYKEVRGGAPSAGHTTYTWETKQRWRADPFGFALLSAGYTARQWAILASLGLTKAPRLLRSAF
jgi:hypothetical protein